MNCILGLGSHGDRADINDFFFAIRIASNSPILNLHKVQHSYPLYANALIIHNYVCICMSVCSS
jgi:hypothetical protein